MPSLSLPAAARQMSLGVGKRIIITGASSGLGAAIARVTAHRGHHFFLTGRNESRLDTVAKVRLHTVAMHLLCGHL
jgi:short-subunit dehydrogenase